MSQHANKTGSHKFVLLVMILVCLRGLCDIVYVMQSKTTRTSLKAIIEGSVVIQMVMLPIILLITKGKTL